MNIIKFLEKEMEKGNLFITAKGDIVNNDKLNEGLKKQYVNEARAGKLDVTEVSFAKYAEEKAHTGGYISTTSILENVKALITNPDTTKPVCEDPEPFEEDLPQTPYHN